jgi:Ribosomal RNA large subunit methyltransferase D, RlmJ
MPLPSKCAGWRSGRSAPSFSSDPRAIRNRLNGAGLIIVNPPWTLENDLSALLPALSAILGPVGKGGFRLDWLPPGDGGSMASFHSPAVGV